MMQNSCHADVRHPVCILFGRHVVWGVMTAITWMPGSQSGCHSAKVCARRPPVNRMAGTSKAFSVVGVRADGSRHVMSLKLSLEDATYLQAVLHRAAIFQKVVIERDQAQFASQTPKDVADDRGRHVG
jgi:hypothetical protein